MFKQETATDAFFVWSFTALIKILAEKLKK